MNRKNYIPCDKHPDCFGHHYAGSCSILTDNNFKGRDCPFYKPKEQSEQEANLLRQLEQKANCIRQLVERTEKECKAVLSECAEMIEDGETKCQN